MRSRQLDSRDPCTALEVQDRLETPLGPLTDKLESKSVDSFSRNQSSLPGINRNLNNFV